MISLPSQGRAWFPTLHAAAVARGPRVPHSFRRDLQWLTVMGIEFPSMHQQQAAGQRRRSTAVCSTLIRTAVARRSTMARGMLNGAGWDWTGLDARAASQGSRGLQAAGGCPATLRLAVVEDASDIDAAAGKAVRHGDAALSPPLLKQRQCSWHGQSSSPEQPELQCAPPQTIAGLCSSSPQKTGTRQSDGMHGFVLLQAAGSIQVWRRWRVMGVPVTSKK
jgi:hypothetical protein